MTTYCSKLDFTHSRLYPTFFHLSNIPDLLQNDLDDNLVKRTFAQFAPVHRQVSFRVRNLITRRDIRHIDEVFAVRSFSY